MNDAAPVKEKDRTAINRFPYELLLQVLEYLYYNEAHVPDHRAMASYSLISKAWAPVAQRLLFHEVHLSTQKEVKSLKRAISRKTERGKYLGNSIRILNFKTVCQDHNTDGRKFIGLSQLEPLLALCPGLYELSICFFQVMKLSSEVVSGWKKHAPPIKALRISNIASQGSSTVSQTVGIWPSVQFLSIRGEAISQEVPNDVPSLRLIELGWYGKTIPNEEYLKWLLSGSDKTLRAFHMAENGGRNPTEYRPLSLVARSHSAHLRSLRIYHITAEQLQLFRRLEELVLFGTQQFRREVMKALPQSISHISFVLTTSEEGTTLLLMVYKPFPNLRSITCFRPKLLSKTPVPDKTLQQEFGAKNVSLIFYDGDEVVLKGLRCDHVPGFRSPGVPVRNYPAFPSVEAMRERNQAVAHQVAEYEALVQQQKSRFLGVGRLLPVLMRKSGTPQLG